MTGSQPLSCIDWSTSGRYIQTLTADYDIVYWSLVELTKVKTNQEIRNEAWASHTCPLGFMVHGIWAGGREAPVMVTVDRGPRGDVLASGTRMDLLDYTGTQCSTPTPDTTNTKCTPHTSQPSASHTPTTISTALEEQTRLSCVGGFLSLTALPTSDDVTVCLHSGVCFEYLETDCFEYLETDCFEYLETDCFEYLETDCFEYLETDCFEYLETDCFEYLETDCFEYLETDCFEYQETDCFEYLETDCFEYQETDCFEYQETDCFE
ncbi:hypothetical protein Pmani_038951 [Petrolisthes manimaculis]|uniref:Uncharacterized protein n=1 Tax=Petrolisthes manimaculis TaxID=1843537 RepID=A0AAE1NDD4_9EUCA|nr:hypothetical protein Pmani_038951 [Petrolisthes manimaculis]